MALKDQWIADYWKSVDALAAHDKAVAPLIAERDALQAQLEPKLRELNQRIRAAQAPRFDLSERVKFLARAVGEVGERPAA